MYKVAILLAVAAMVAAEPNGLLGVNTVVPAVNSVSAYSTSIVHPPAYANHGLWGANNGLWGANNGVWGANHGVWGVNNGAWGGVHGLHKRSIGAIAPLGLARPVGLWSGHAVAPSVSAWGNPWVTGAGAYGHGAGAYGYGAGAYGYGAGAYGRGAWGVHPW